MINSKLMGGTLLIAGTAVGAGMLAIPMVLAQFGLLWGTLLMLFIWLGTTYAALLLLEATLKSGGGLGMNSIARKTLGKGGQLLTNALLYALVVCLMIAYIVSAGDILQQLLNRFSIQISLLQSQIIFTGVSAFFIAQGTAMIDKLNRLLFFVMISALLLILIYLLPNMALDNILQVSNQNKIELIKNSAVLFTSFGFMVVIPSVVKYNQEATHKQLRNMVVIGSTIPLFCYLLWLYAVAGNLPLHQLVHFSNVSDLISILGKTHKNLEMFLSLFTSLAILTSFIGVSMSLFDQNRDLFEKNRFVTAVITFSLPMFGAIWAQDQFIGVLAYAGLILVFLAIFIPLAMVRQIRINKINVTYYQVCGGSLSLAVCFLFGLFLLVSQLI
ncbi:tyrosine transporter [Psychromonas sp. CNPT3]|uniref:amino acid permease n=1 Tax=Psychromonas sp. CNPT3 TaxID=314282 RepID=UPI00006EA020|nr:aromatic amino acid transport family protein [Psychromonas sp. CNPT3]AGH80374.1 tyrosine transporter [Psychromonas sp. CNPT3]